MISSYSIFKFVARLAARVLPASWMTDKSLFLIWEQKGAHITPVHFGEPAPDTRELKDELWARPSAMIGIEMPDEEQLDLLSQLASTYRSEYERFPAEPTASPSRYYLNNGMYLSADAEILYCLVRRLKPKRVLEIGSGFSTRLTAQAILKNREETGRDCELIAVEPYPDEILRAGFPGLGRLIEAKAQDLPFSEVERLEENDILFIDSSHILNLGGDVQCEYLEWLPRLKPGVVVQVHDIFLPCQYPKAWAKEYFVFPNEQYLLQAFLAFNDRFRVLWAANYMSVNHPDQLEKAFPSYRRGGESPRSFWFKRVR